MRLGRQVEGYTFTVSSRAQDNKSLTLTELGLSALETLPLPSPPLPAVLPSACRRTATLDTRLAGVDHPSERCPLRKERWKHDEHAMIVAKFGWNLRCSTRMRFSM